VRPKRPHRRINNLVWAKLNRRNGPDTLAKRITAGKGATGTFFLSFAFVACGVRNADRKKAIPSWRIKYSLRSMCISSSSGHHHSATCGGSLQASRPPEVPPGRQRDGEPLHAFPPRGQLLLGILQRREPLVEPGLRQSAGRMSRTWWQYDPIFWQQPANLIAKPGLAGGEAAFYSARACRTYRSMDFAGTPKPHAQAVPPFRCPFDIPGIILARLRVGLHERSRGLPQQLDRVLAPWRGREPDRPHATTLPRSHHGQGKRKCRWKH
jgi:hypothetical protein